MLDPQKKAQLDFYIKQMLANGASQQDVINYANDFRAKFNSSAQQPIQKSTPQPQIKQATTKPSTVKPEEKLGWTQKFSNYMSNLFGSDDLPTKVDNNLSENKVDVKKIQDPTAPDIQQTEFSKTGYAPKKSESSNFVDIREKYNEEIIKIKQNLDPLIKEGENSSNSLVKQQSEKFKQIRDKKVNELVKKRNAELALIKAKPSFDGEIVDEFTKKIKTNDIQNNLIVEQEKLKNIKSKSILDFMPEAKNVKEDIFKALNPIDGLLDLWEGYSLKQAKVKEIENKINTGKKDLNLLNIYNLDVEETLKNLPVEKRLQLEMALDPELQGLAKGAKKYAGREDEVSIRNILSNPFTRKDVKIKNLTAETNEKNFYEKLNNNAKARTDFYNSSAKDKLQQQLVQSKLDNVFDVNTPEFNTLVNNYDKIAQDPRIITQIYQDKDPQELIQKLLILNNNPEFQKIINNEKYFNSVNDARVGNNLQNFIKQGKDNLQAINYLEKLGKAQQLKEDYIEQQADEKGFFSMANARSIGTQALEGIDFTWLTGKSFAGTIGGLVTGDKFEGTRQLQAQAETFKAINFAQDESELSPYANSKWIVIPVKGGSNYQVAVDEQGNFLTARSHNLSYPVNDPQKLEELQNYYKQNKNDLLKNTKELSDIDGGYSAMAGYIGAKVGQGLLEEIPSMALEVGLTQLSGGASSALAARRLAKWGDKLLEIKKSKERYDKVASTVINGLSTYAEIGYGVRKDYEEQGLNPEFYNTLITSGALTAVAQLTPALENTYQRLGNTLAGQEIKKEARNLLVKDMPEVIKMLSDATVNIADKRKRDFIFNKELRNYVVSRLGEAAGVVGKKFGKEGLQEAAEETIFEPIAQVFANAVNAALTGNDLYNKQTLKDLGFLDPETALIAGLTGGIMSSGVEGITDLMTSKKNAFNSLDNLQAAINNPEKFKSFLSTYLNNSDGSGKNLTQEQLDNVIGNFDTISNNYNQTKQSFGFNEDFVSRFNFDNPAQQQLFNAIGLNQSNLSNFNGEKTLNNLILQNEVNKVKGAQVAADLTNTIGEEINGQKTLQPFLNENGLIDITKLKQKELDKETTDLIRNYNTNVAKDLKLNNTLNLFKENFGPIQDEFLNDYQQILLNNPDLSSPELGLYDNLYQDKLFNKLLNNKRINEINKALSIGQGLTRDAELQKELDELNNANKELDKGLDYIKNTFKEGFLDAQNEVNTLAQEFQMLDMVVNKHLDDYFNGSIDNFLDLEEKDLNTLDEQASQQLNEVIKKKEQKLKDLKKAYSNANKKYNNGIVTPLLSNDNITNLEKSIKKDKDLLQRIKDHRKLYTKLRKGKISLNELLRLKNNNMSYSEEVIKTKVLPYYLNFTKDELDFAFSQDPDLLLAFYSVLEDLDYLPELENYKKNYTTRTEENIDLNYLSAVIQDAMSALSYNVALVNAGKTEEIYLEKDRNGAILALNLMKGVTQEIVETSETSETEQESNLGDTIPQIPEINVTDKQQETIDLINKNTIPKSEFNEDEITGTHYIINGEKYQRVTGVETPPIETNKYLVAGSNVGNFFDNVGRIIFANNQITEQDAITIAIELANMFASKGIIIKLNKDNFTDIVKKLVQQRDELVKQGYVFISDEKILYNRYDGSNFETASLTSVGIAGTMDIIAIAPDGSIDIIDLKTISDNKGKADIESVKKEQTSWAKQLGFYRTMLEKIPGRKVGSVKVLKSKVTYSLDETGNLISGLNFNSLNLVPITVSDTLLSIINKYLSISNFTPELDEEKVISENPIIEEAEQVIEILGVPLVTEVEVTEFEFNDQSEEISEGDFTFVDEESGVYETMEDLDPNFGTAKEEDADAIFGTTETEVNEVKFESEKQVPVNINNTEKDEIQEEEVVKDNNPSNPNISSLMRFSYIRFESVGDRFTVVVDNNFKLNDKFKNKTFTKEELQEAFQKEGLFFPKDFKTYEKVGNKNVYIARNQSDDSPIPSFIQTNVLNKQPLTYNSINRLDSQDFTGQNGQVVVLDTTDGYNQKLNETDFLNKAALGVVVNNQLVSIIPANHPVRKQIKLVKQGNSFNIEPFNIKIDKVKKGGILFNPKIKTNVSEVINQAKNLGFNVSSIAYVGVERDQLVFKTKDENNNDILSKVSITENTKKGSVYLLLQNDKKETIKIPLKTPKLKEFLESRYSEEDIQKIKQIFVNAVAQTNLQGETLQDIYKNFRSALENNPSNVVKQILNTIPQDIGTDKFSTPNQKTKYKKLESNFTPENLFEYLSETLITLNNETKTFYTADVDLENFYADNSVVISYSQTNNVQETELENTNINPDLNNFDNISQDFGDVC